MDVLGSACWLPSWEKGNHKNTETESGKNYPVLLMQLHQTHWGSKVPTLENGEHYFLMSCLLAAESDLPVHSCMESYLPEARRNWQIILHRAACYLNMDQGFALWKGSCLRISCSGAAQLVLQLPSRTTPPPPPPERVRIQVSCLKCSFLVPFMSPCTYISKQGHYPFFRFIFQ